MAACSFDLDLTTGEKIRPDEPWRILGAVDTVAALRQLGAHLRAPGR